MFEITRLTKCTFEELLLVWNQGFQGYPLNMTSTVDNLVARFGRDTLSPELSLVAWMKGRPVGFILNGYRRIRGTNIAWNGGTGVVPEYRRSGVGHRLMEVCMDVYRDNGIETAMLESLAQNTAAISLYKRYGYRVVDEVAVMSTVGALPSDSFSKADVRKTHYTVRRGTAADAAGIAFYRAFGPWQTQWMNINQGQSVILEDSAGIAAYALFNQQTNDEGQITGIGLFQCEAAPGFEDSEAAIHTLLREVYGPDDYACRRTTSNIPCENRQVMSALETAGFTVFAKQVVMMRDMGE